MYLWLIDFGESAENGRFALICAGSLLALWEQIDEVCDPVGVRYRLWDGPLWLSFDCDVAENETGELRPIEDLGFTLARIGKGRCQSAWAFQGLADTVMQRATEPGSDSPYRPDEPGEAWDWHTFTPADTQAWFAALRADFESDG